MHNGAPSCICGYHVDREMDSSLCFVNVKLVMWWTDIHSGSEELFQYYCQALTPIGLGRESFVTKIICTHAISLATLCEIQNYVQTLMRQIKLNVRLNPCTICYFGCFKKLNPSCILMLQILRTNPL